MKKISKIVLIIMVVLIILGCLFLIISKNKKPTEDINKDSLITCNISNDIKYETAFIINNTYMAIVLENKSNDNIIKANLNVKFENKEISEEINMLTKDNKTLVLVKVPDNLVSNILKEKISITLNVTKKGETNSIDVFSLNKDVKYTTTLNNNYININVEGNNTTSKDIKVLNGIILLYNQNKLVGATTFGIENISNKKDFSYVVSYPYVTYEKIEVYYTYAY